MFMCTQNGCNYQQGYSCHSLYLAKGLIFNMNGNQNTWVKTIVKDHFSRKEIDVTNKTIILWGAGQFASDMIYDYQIEKIDYVVDKDKSVVGKNLYFFDKKYTVYNINIIRNLIPSDICILIGSCLYREEILEEIHNEYNDKLIVCSTFNDYIREYSELSYLFMCDPIINKKIFQGHVSLRIKEIIKKTKQIINMSVQTEQIVGYRPVKEGFGISFLIVMDLDVLIMHISTHNPGLFRNIWATNPEIKKIIYHNKLRLGINKSITVYEDSDGYSIQKYGNSNVDWSNFNYIKKVLSTIRRIHLSDIDLKYVNDIIDYSSSFSDFLAYTVGDIIIDVDFERVSENIVSSLQRGQTLPCHNDLIPENIIVYDGEIEIIDFHALGSNHRLQAV